MNYEYYKIFYYVAKHKNITKAAAELYSSQPAVTRTIQNMESELGCKLFLRGKTGVELTHEGQILYEYASVACRQLIKAEEELGQNLNPENGTIYIGATVTALHCYLFTEINKFHAKYPRIKLKISTQSTAQTIEKLKNGTVDLAFVTTPFANCKGLTVKKLMRFENVLIAGKRFSALKDKPQSMRDISEYPLICLNKGMQLREFIDDIYSAHGLVCDPDIEADSADLIVPMVEHDWGLGFVPEQMAETALAKGTAFKVTLKEELPRREVCLITDGGHQQTRASYEFQKSLVK